MKLFLFFIATILLLTGCTHTLELNPAPFMPRQKIELKTTDGVAIVGDFQGIPVKRAQGFVLLLHMMPATRASWYPFMDTLASMGFASLAIDLRGHGESTAQSSNKMLDYKKFSDAEHQASIHDVAAAYEWLKNEQGASDNEMVLGGASIGANLALQFLANHPAVSGAFLLSPGLDYRGITAEAFAKKILPSQRVFLAASDDDDYSLKTNRILAKALKRQPELKELHNAGHGTHMFEQERQLMDDIGVSLFKHVPTP